MAFSFAKAGSTLLYNMLQALCNDLDIDYFSVEDQLFAANTSSVDRICGIGDVFKPEGFCYGGFRQFPAYPIPILHQVKKILLVRDPRDMAVSLYFSLLRSHSLPEGSDTGGRAAEMMRSRERLETVGLDNYTTSSAIVQFAKMFESYVAGGFLWRSDTVIYRYEDVIFNKQKWLGDICDWFGWSVKSSIIDRVAKQFDVRPNSQRPDSHIRAVTPGDYKDKLSKAAASQVASSLAEYMKLFGYSDA